MNFEKIYTQSNLREGRRSMAAINAEKAEKEARDREWNTKHCECCGQDKEYGFQIKISSVHSESKFICKNCKKEIDAAIVEELRPFVSNLSQKISKDFGIPQDGAERILLEVSIWKYLHPENILEQDDEY